MFDAIGAPFKEKGVFSKWITIGIPYINSSLERKHQGTHDVYQCAKRLTKEIEQKKKPPPPTRSSINQQSLSWTFSDNPCTL